MPLTKLSIDVPDLGDNNKNLEVEGAIAVGEKVAVSVTGLPADVSTSEEELRLRVLGPMGEDVATHGGWNYDGTKKTYTTTLDLASVQAFRLFFPPPPPPRHPVVPPVVPMRPPVPPQGYDPVAAAMAMQPPNAVNVRLVLELRDKSGSDSDSDGELVDASLIGTSSIRLNYWPTDWQTATLVDLANGRVYSKDEVDALIAEEARQRGAADAAEAAARAAGDEETFALSKAYADEKALLLDRNINTKYAKPSGGIPKSDLSAFVQASLSKADTALQEHQDISGKADLVGGKVPSSQLPSYVDDVLEYTSLSAFPESGEEGKIYVAKDTNSTYRWSGSEYVQIGGGEIPIPVAPSTDPSAAGKPADAKATGDALAGKAQLEHTHSSITSQDGNTKVVVNSDGTASVEVEKSVLKSRSPKTGDRKLELVFCDSAQDIVAGIQNGISFTLVSTTGSPGRDGTFQCTAALMSVASTTKYGPIVGWKDDGLPDSFIEFDSEGVDEFSGWSISAGGWKNETVSAGTKMIATVDQIPAPIPNVQADWDESDSDSDAFIQNKPTIPSPVDISGKADSASLAPAFSTSSTYAVGDYVTHEGLLYKCTTVISTAEDWTAAHWTSVAVTDEMGGGSDQTKADAVVVAPAFTAKAYVVDEKCTSAGRLYNCKSAYTATESSDPPGSDSTHWDEVTNGLVPWANAEKNAVTIGKRKGNAGTGSLAVGLPESYSNGAEASGKGSIAVGNATASGMNSAAFGIAKALGLYSFAAGSATADGQNGAAFGSSSTSNSSSNEFAAGEECIANGRNSIALGYRARTGSGTGSGAGTALFTTFVWNQSSTYYHSKGAGTFCINPSGGTSGFYIGNDSLSSLLAAKADKVASATSGNFAGLDANGNLTDSGKKASDFATAQHTHSTLVNGEATVFAGDDGTLKVSYQPTLGDVAAHLNLGDSATLDDVRQALNLGNDATLEDALAAIAAPVATGAFATTRNVADASRYDLVTVTPTVSGTAASATLQDRAINTVDIGSPITQVSLAFPPAVAGKARDFFVRFVCAGTSVATISAPVGETIDFGASDLADITGKSGTHLTLFTEIAANHWLVSTREAES